MREGSKSPLVSQYPFPKLVEHTFLGLENYIGLVRTKCPSLHWIYRGQGNLRLPLRPKAGRPEFFLQDTLRRSAPGAPPPDISRFQQWRQQAIAYCDQLPDDEFECLAFAQHYGLATRLLDWTTNPLAALFFALESNPEVEGAVFCYLAVSFLDTDRAICGVGPDVVTRYDPRPFDRRILAQAGVFTYHPEPEIEMAAGEARTDMLGIAPHKASWFAPDKVDLVMIRIPANMKPILQRELSEVGVSRKSLFPDLEGLSQFVNWETQRMNRTREDAQ